MIFKHKISLFSRRKISYSISYVLIIIICLRIAVRAESDVVTEYSAFDPDSLNVLYYDDAVSDNATKFTYKKCYCDIQQAWVDGECVDIEAEVAVSLLQNLRPESEIFLDFVLSSVEIQDVRCSGTNFPLELRQNSLFLSENGELYSEDIDYIFSSSDYCFEFIKENDNIDIIARGCMSPPILPFCNNQKASDISSLHLNISFANDFITVNNFDILTTEEPICLNKNHRVIIPLETGNRSLSFYFMSNTIHLLWQPPSYSQVPEVFSSAEFCILKNNSPKSYAVNFCYEDHISKHNKLCKNSVCVRKCCPDNYIYNSTSRTCSSYHAMENLSIPPFYSLQKKAFVEVPEKLVIEYSFPWCPTHRLYMIDPKMNPSDEFFLLTNGSLYISLSAISMPPSLYCVDSFLDAENVATIKAISCFLEEANEIDHCKNTHRILYPILIVISCIFLGITLIVYSAIPELHAKLHGKSLLSHVFSLLIAFLCQLVVSWRSKSLSMTGCKIIALGNQVSFLWAFFWLNVMCFDIWWTLRTMSLIPKTGESSRRRFVLYSLYAWGCPIIIGFFTALMEFLPNSVDKSKLVLPGFGVRGCWFQDVQSTWIYFHGFTLSLYVLNILFFFHVAAILINGQLSTEGILRTTRQQHKERVYLYFKLFVVMGITWVCEVASWQEGTCKYWIFTDIVNSFQGVMIFFIFMCNKKVFQKIQSKGIPFFRRLKAHVRTPSSEGPGVTRTNSSSQRITQTTDESSLRRLSSSLPSSDNIQFKS